MGKYRELMQAVGMEKIGQFHKGREFVLREVIPNPQALWGRLFYRDVISGKVIGVIPLDMKDEENASMYKKL